MNGFVIPILLLVLVLPIAWFISEFKAKKRSTRCVLGTLSILGCFGAAWFAIQVSTMLSRFNYNAWYGGATMELIDATISQIEIGNTELVLKELKQLQTDFGPTYQSRAHYDELVDQTVERMKDSN